MKAGLLSDGGGHQVDCGVGPPAIAPSGTLGGHGNSKYPQSSR